MKNNLSIINGQIIDPETELIAFKNVGITNGIITEISDGPINSEKIIDAKNEIISPGFIDLHSHPQDNQIFELQAFDGVTTTLELEVGTADIKSFYKKWEGQSRINFGASIGHIPVRMNVMDDPGDFVPAGDAGSREASNDEIIKMKHLITEGLEQGALAVGFGLDYTRACTKLEVIELFKIAAKYNVSCHVHLRGKGHREPNNSIEALEEVIAASAVTGAALHVVHINSTGMKAVPILLDMIQGAKKSGLDVSTECYPYTAGMTKIESKLFEEGWQSQYGISYDKLMRPDTGEYLTESTFHTYRETGGWVIAFSTPQNDLDYAVKHPLTMIATDSIIENGKGHPRTAGTFSKVLGEYVREKKQITLIDALKKMTIMPAQRLEKRAPIFKKKGRLQVGTHADIVTFNPNTIIDTSSYTNPTSPPNGISNVIVGGNHLIHNKTMITNQYPGTGILASST